VVLLATAPGEAGRPRKGRVVRVERTKVEAAQLPRMCQPRSDGGASCFGRGVAPGEEGTVIDETGVRARLRIDQVTPSLDGCGNAQWWDVVGTVQSGDLSTMSPAAMMLVGWRVSRSARIASQPVDLAPLGRPAESAWLGVDDDGDGDAELVVTSFPCDAAGQYSSSGTTACLSYYVADGRSLRQLRVDHVATCY
jgi:hypothetical protein